jgi:GT2 family glycosyltransferase
MKGAFMDIDEISVIISTYDDPIIFVSQCLNSLLYQEKISEIIVVDSSKKEDIKNFCYSLNSDKINYVYTPPRGLSDARNKGIKVAKKDIIAFTDADCITEKNWAENICISFSGDDKIAVAGGKILPKWLSKPNKILLNSAIAQGFYSSFDIGEELEEVEHIFGGNFAISKGIGDQLFLSQLGRQKGSLVSGEDLDFCWRIRKKGLKVIYNPKMIVHHQIPEERIKSKWMWKRMYYGGVTRAMLGGQPTPKTVNFVSYNFYDILFLAIFMAPYLYGLVTTKIKQKY